ncbi:MAG: ABC transporter permease [Archaeoglobaceae archaeon]
MRAVSILLFLLLWTGVSTFTSLAYPHEVAAKFLQIIVAPEPILGKSLLEHTFASLSRVLTASAAAFTLAVPLGLSGYFPRARDLIMPMIEILRPIPPLAWIPIAYIIFAPFPNTSLLAQLYIVFVGAFFPCVVAVFDAARSVPEEYIEMAEVFGASNSLILKEIVVPYCLQGIVTGIRLGLGVGWMSIVAAEMIAGSGDGLGYFILVMYEVGGRTAEIVSGIAMIGAVGYIMNEVLLRLERVLAPWRS